MNTKEEKFLDSKGVAHLWKLIVNKISSMIPTKVSQLENDKHYVNNCVTSFNGKTGDVVYSSVTSVNDKRGNVKLGASDVHALPDNTYIPREVTEKTVTNWGFVKLSDGVYIMPTTGIPYSDMSDSIKANLDKASHSIQEETDPTVPSWAKTPTKPEYDYSEITNTPTISVVGISGKYKDLLDKPSIPAAQVNADWNANSGVAQILNKPTIPVVPTNVSAFTNDAGYLTQHQDISGKEDVTTIVAPVNVTDATLPITALNCEVGKYYRIDVAVDTLAVTLPAMTDLTTVRTVVIYLTGGTTPAVTIIPTDDKSVVFQDGYEIKSGVTYEVNCLYNGAVWVVGALTINTEG